MKKGKIMKLASLLSALLLAASVGSADMLVKPMNMHKVVAAPSSDSTSSNENELTARTSFIFVGPMMEHTLPSYQGAEWEMVDKGMIFATHLSVQDAIGRLKEYMSGQCKNTATSLATDYDQYAAVLDHFQIKLMSPESQYSVAYGNLHCFLRRAQ